MGMGKYHPKDAREGVGSQPHVWHCLVIEDRSGRNYFSMVSGIIPSPTVIKGCVPSGDYIALVFLHRDGGFYTPIKKIIIQ